MIVDNYFVLFIQAFSQHLLVNVLHIRLHTSGCELMTHYVSTVNYLKKRKYYLFDIHFLYKCNDVWYSHLFNYLKNNHLFDTHMFLSVLLVWSARLQDHLLEQF